ncbi:MAG: hypothetical protein RSD22_09765 [Romboutsia sp.]
MIERNPNKDGDILFSKGLFDSSAITWQSSGNSKIVIPGEEELIIL